MADVNAPNKEILPEENRDVDLLLVNSMNNKLCEISKQTDENVRLIRVPEYIRNRHKELYEPKIISIGPYHRGAKLLEPMEEQKWRSLSQLLSLRQQEGIVNCRLIDLVKVVRSLEARARSAYEENVSLNSNEFVEMMVLDGCFIVLFMSNSDHWNVESGISIRNSDLLLLENQIPFFIIQRLFTMFFPHKTENVLFDQLANFMFNATGSDELKPLYKPAHLVHLYYYWFLLTQTPSVKNFPYLKKPASVPHPSRYPTTSPGLPHIKLTTRAPIKVIPSATALQEAGVKFKRRTSSRDLFHVTFRKGVMEISSVILDNTRKRLYLNLIAFEQSQAKGDLTSFAKLMDMLIDTHKDVAILEKSGILHNLLANAEEASRFFNQICECATVDYNNNYLALLIQDVRQYCQSPWHRHRAVLVRNYFSNPWSIISFIAGIILLILSFLQVYFTVKPPKHS